MNQIELHSRESRAPETAGGWLLVLCAVLTLWTPLQLAASASIALGALTVRGPLLGVLLVVRLMVAGLGIAAGMMLFGRRPSAVAVARCSLIVTALVDLFIEFTPYYPTNRVPGDEWIAASLSLSNAAIWLLYLAKSRRVARTFGE